MPTTRRGFLRTMAGTASLGLADMPMLGGLEVFGAETPPDKVRFGPDIEPIVRLIEETPQEKCISVFIDEMRRGLSYRRLLTGVFFAGIREQRSHHEVYRIHSVHQVSLDVLPEERLLPLFWALNVYKERQHFFLPTLPELHGDFPAADKAAAEFQAGMESSDLDRSERALVSLARNQGARQTAELLWPYGCRNEAAGGHAAIAVANCFRAMETIGWQQAVPTLRFILRDLYSDGREKPDRYCLPNQARVDQHLKALPASWAGVKGDAGATRELFALIREGKADAACELATKQLLGGVEAQALWDAVHLGTSELMVRHNDGWGLASRPLHSNTSINALHYAFRTCMSEQNRLLLLLQGIAWAAHKTGGELASRGLRDLKIVELAGTALPASSADAVTDIFSLLPTRTYHWDDQAKQAILTYGQRADADLACRKVFALAQDRPEAIPLFRQSAHSWLCRKANNDSHEYKYLAAILEDAALVSPAWQPHLLAASVHYFHGTQSPDNPVVQQAREALGKT